MNNTPIRTILVVDDVPENITTLAGVLRDQYRVLFALSGPDALETLKTESVDLILLDIMMPEMDGYEVCRRIRANLTTRDIPVIFVTALGDTSDELRGLAAGAVDFLHKPCVPAIVRLRVQLHIERYDQQLTLERLVRERTQELEQTRIEIVRRLGRAAEYRDNETGMHVIRVGSVSRILALAAGVPSAQAELLLHAAPMHDIGKIGIPDYILIKPGVLTPDEWELMKTHPRIGAEIIGQNSSTLMCMARTVALTHHEKWDGGGYPDGLSGEDIPLEGRIVAIADVFDALTSERPYKRPWSMEKALAHMQSQAGLAFDPALIDLFSQLIPSVEAIAKQYSDQPHPEEPST